MGLKIKLVSILVENQDHALRFYTDVVGFKPSKDIEVGGGFRWITVVAPDGHPDVELALEPTDMGAVTIAVFADTCGNLIQIYQAPK